jgi:Lar family restriction alleviation protein
MNELKKCPFCGADAHKRTHYNDRFEITGYSLACNKCITTTSEYKTEQKAIAAWNRRVPQQKDSTSP